MEIPPSPHFTPLSLADSFNLDRTRLDGGLASLGEAAGDWSATEAFGPQAFCGIPFSLGQPDRPNMILLGRSPDSADVRIELPPTRATYLIFLHAVEDRP